MKIKLSIVVLFCLTHVMAFSQKASGEKNIEKLCGCFEVEFKYAETFAPDEEYKYHNRERISAGVELVLPIEKSPGKFMLQHLLVINDTTIVKHWRDDWTFENPVLFLYSPGKTWTKSQLSAAQVKGKWTQTVWEVSDAPRYQGISEWVTTDGKSFWQNTTDAPLPRREYTKRSDYNVMKRMNRILVNQDGWIHEQDNQKIQRTGQTDNLIVEEKGLNTYKRINDTRCSSALKYWEKNKDYWAKVRSVWDTYLASHNTVTVKDNIDGKSLNKSLDEMAESFSSKKISTSEIELQIKSTLEKYIGGGKPVAKTE